MKTILVVPTNRPEQLIEFLAEWQEMGDWDELVIVEDGPRRTLDLGCPHFSWAEIDRELGPDAWIISRRDSAIRAFGFLMAARMGAEYVLTLDDDVRPLVPGQQIGICEGHLQAMASHTRWVSTVPDVRPRGLPYRELGQSPPVMANMGLWAGIPDQDAPQALLNPVENYRPPVGSRLVHPQQFIPVCGMNLAIKRDAIPLFYFPLMGEGQPYRRMDDIWAGAIAQRCMRALGWALSYGDPPVEHVRASDPFANLIKEAPGVRANEVFWRLVDQVELTATTATGCMRQIGESLEDRRDEYWHRLGRAMQVWASLFENCHA